MTTQEQDRAFAELSYTNFTSNNIDERINAVNYMPIRIPDDPISSDVQTTISNMSDWKISKISDNSATGFYGVEFENVVTGEIKFAFRGTKASENYGIDLVADAQILSGISGLPLQFNDAKNFIIAGLAQKTQNTEMYVQEHLSELVVANNVSFTGHSLGGGIAEYATAITGGSSVTFNAPGIEQLLSNYANMFRNSLALGDPNDLTFNMGTHAGEVRTLVQSSGISTVDSELMESFAKVLLLSGDPFIFYSNGFKHFEFYPWSIISKP